MRRGFIALMALLALAAAACSESTGSTEGTVDTTATTEAVAVTTVAPSGGGGSGGGDAVNGEALYSGTCVACHGPAGEGVEGLGLPFVGSEFVSGQSDDELVAFINAGRTSDDPANTTGIAMLPKGGNPGLTDADLLDIVTFIRTLSG